MPRGPKPRPPTTALGVALRQRRALLSQSAIESDIGVDRATLSRIERGTHRPSIDTALALARWLGWSVEQVMEAAGRPVEPYTSADG